MSSCLKPSIQIAKVLLCLAIFATLGFWSRSAQSTLPTNQQTFNNFEAATLVEEDFTALKQTVLDRVNQYRSTKDLPALELDSIISQQAEVHSENMATGQVPFSHEGFKERIQAIKTKISYRRAAENLAYNSGYSNPAKRAVEGWIDSSRHRQNMLGNYNLTGIGIAKNRRGEYYFTQIFILEN